MYVNWQAHELDLKIVYYGPALSGKTTNLEQIHARMDPTRRSKLISLKTDGDRTLFFDFLQLELGKIGELTPKIHLYTVPGQTYYEASRKVVLQGVDGIVFVVDSVADRLSANVELWNSMKNHTAALQIPIETLPLIVQFNKQDLPNALPPTILRALLRVSQYSTFPAAAIQGYGVFDTLKAIIQAVMVQVQTKIAP
jgi:signal recognition particle receptor subunit beta